LRASESFWLPSRPVIEFFSCNQLMAERWPSTPAIISGEAAGFELARFDPKDKEQVEQRISESKALHPSKFGCPGNPAKDLAKKDTTHTEHRIYIVKEDVAGIIGYCSLAVSKDVYIATDEKR